MKKYLTVIITTVFMLAAVTGMIIFMMYRDTASEGGSLTNGDNPDGGLIYGDEKDEEPIIVENAGGGKEGYFCIPLEDGISENDLGFTENIIENTTILSIPAKDEDYYYNNNLSGSNQYIKDIGFNISDGRVYFEIKTNDLVTHQSLVEDGCLYISYDKPRKLYDRIILIDAGHGGEDKGTEAYDIREKDVTLGVAKKISVSGNPATGIFFTRLDDSKVSEDERREAAKKLKPDLVVTIHANADSATRITRGLEVYYNDEKLEFDARKLARSLSQLTESSKMETKMKKKIPGFEDIDIPCIFIRLGYMTNKSEAVLIAGDEYAVEAAKAIEEIF